MDILNRNSQVRADGSEGGCVKSKKDYIHFFRSAVGGGIKARFTAFRLAGCAINRECKIQPIHAYYKQFKDCEVVQYVGIAHDEKKRLARLKAIKFPCLISMYIPKIGERRNVLNMGFSPFMGEGE